MNSAPLLREVVELESLAAAWLAMTQAKTLHELEAATLAGLLRMVDFEIAYTSRLEDRKWTISAQVGLHGDVAGILVPEELVPYAEALRAGRTICYERASDMGPDLASMLASIGLGSLFAVPIMRDGECVGGLAIGRPADSTFDTRDRTLVNLFTMHLTALLENRELVSSFERLAEFVPVIVLRTDPTGWINWYNHRWYEYTGQTPEEAAGWGWQTAHHPVDFQRVIEEWPRALATGEPIEIEFRLRRYDGIYHWHLARVEPVRDDKGRIRSWYGTVIDIDAQKEALERTRRVADALQQAFLPQSLPQRERLRLDASYVSAESDALVGGDWYDAFELPDGRMGFSIGDVGGHGLQASLAVGNLRQSLYTLALRCDDPAEILAEVNGILRIQRPDEYVTAILGFVDRDGTQIRYSVAGHPPPMLAERNDRAARIIPGGGVPLGVSGQAHFITHTVPIPVNAVVVLYTDGVTEFNRDAVAGEARLLSAIPVLVGNTAGRPAERLYRAVLGDAVPRDDAAILVLQFSPNAAAPYHEPGSPTMRWRFHASDAQAAHVARMEVGTYIFSVAGKTEEAYASELIVGELLANTVEHAPGLVDLRLEWTDDAAILTVRDSGPGLNSLKINLPSDPMNEGSRGLYLAQTLSKDVSLTPSPSGGAEIRVILPVKMASEPPATD
jgi:PAS domain S-box-containing protein